MRGGGYKGDLGGNLVGFWEIVEWGGMRGVLWLYFCLEIFLCIFLWFCQVDGCINRYTSFIFNFPPP